MDWQPIETAPRDGTPILAALTVHDNRTGQKWQQYDVIYADDETGEIHNDCDFGWAFDDYEVWMPIPPLP